jgi:hypothetical protein
MILTVYGMYPDNMSLVFLIIISVYSYYYYYHYVIIMDIYIYITVDFFLLLLLLFLIPWIEWTNVAWKVYSTTIYGRSY